MYTYNKEPATLYDPKKSTKLCPLTRHYCTPLCAMAVRHKNVPEGEWLCGLIAKVEEGLTYKTVKYQLEE